MRACFRRKWFALLAIVTALTIAGCGGGDAPVSTTDGDRVDTTRIDPVDTTDADPITNPDLTPDPASLLIDSSDLENVSGYGYTPPAQCGPMSMLKTGGGRGEMSETFIVPAGQISEAAAIFPNDRAASAAFKKLNDPARLKCIGQVIAGYASDYTVRRNTEPIDIGDGATQNRYRTLDANSNPLGFADFIAIKLGRCAAALLVASEGRRPSEQLIDSTSATAVDLLSGPCR